jgi:small conductance mechanosensitive channel
MLLSSRVYEIIDSLARTDSLNAVEKELLTAIDAIANKSGGELALGMLDNAFKFCVKVGAAILIYLAGAWLIRKVRKMLTTTFERKKTDATLASFTLSITSISLTIILLLITVGTLGVDTSSIAALLTGGGLAIGLALNGTVQNFAGGIMILIFKPFKAGDYIEAQGDGGTVSEVTITSTKLTTTDNRVIIIPNGTLSNDVINNYSTRQMRRLDLTIGVEYGASSQETKDLLISLIKADERSLTTQQGAPADPFVALSALNDSAVEFTIRVWVNTENYWPLKYHLTEQIYNELPKHGIMFPFPQLDVNIKN